MFPKADGVETPLHHAEFAAFAAGREALDPTVSTPDDRDFDFPPRRPRKLPKPLQHDPAVRDRRQPTVGDNVRT
jgi:hypothetical protein